MFQRRHKPDQRRASGAPICAVDQNERLYAVGDVHGRCDLLEALIEKIGRDAATRSPERRHRIIFLGDYIDRGDQSRQVIDRLILIKQHLGARVEFLSGNHEVALLAFLKDPLKGRSWLDWGGRQTLASYGIAPPSINPDRAGLVSLRDRLHDAMQEHVAFLQNLPKLALSGDVVFVHAGLDPAYPVDAQPDAALYWGQVEGGQVSGLPKYRMVHGHYANYDPVSSERRICVDTGAYFTGRLTAVRLDEEEAFLHVHVNDLIG